MTERRLKHWGWGFEDQAPTATQLREAGEGIRSRFGFGGEVEKPVPLEEVELREARLEVPPDLVAFPKDESEIEAVLGWAEAEGAAVVPFGGGTSVCGGVEPRVGERPVVTMDLRRLDRVVEVDPASLA